MALKEERVQVGTRTFVITAQPTTPGRKLFFRLMKIAGPAFIELVKSVAAEGKKLDEVDVGVIVPAVLELIENLSEQDFDLFYEAFLSSTAELTVDGKGRKANVALDAQEQREQAFAGDYGTMVRWMFEHIRLNFSSFLAGWKPTARPGSLPADPQ